jgi:hypothetical protein
MVPSGCLIGSMAPANHGVGEKVGASAPLVHGRSLLRPVSLPNFRI